MTILVSVRCNLIQHKLIFQISYMYYSILTRVIALTK